MIDLFASIAGIEVTKSVLRATWNNDNDRQQAAEDKLSIYKDDYETIIKEKMAELFHKKNYDTMKFHVNQSQNILKRVINEVSSIYKEPAVRTTKDKRYQEILDSYEFDVFMKRVNRYTNLLNESLIRVGVRFGKLAFDIITPANCSVIQDVLDPTIPFAFYYSVSRANTVIGKKDIVNYYYWDVLGNAYLLNANWQIIQVIYDVRGEGVKGQEDEKIKVSPYVDESVVRAKGDPDKSKRYLLPLVTVHRQFPDSDFWDETSGQDLYNSTVLTGVKFTQFDYAFKFAAHKQMYVVGDKIETPTEQLMDARTMIQIKGEGASAGTLDTQARLDQMEKALVFQINSIINNYGISSDAWTLSVTEASGIALRIRNRALTELRKDQIPVYRKAENDLFELIKVVNNAHAGAYGWEKIEEGATVKTDFGEIVVEEDPHVELRMDVKKLRAGLITPGQFYMKHNPDFTDEKKAEKELLKNLEKLSSVKATHPGLEEALIYILGQDPTPPDEGDPEPDEE